MITPENAVTITEISSIEKIIIEEYKKSPVYFVYGSEKARLFGIISITAKVKGIVNLEGNLINIETPWWGFLASGV